MRITRWLISDTEQHFIEFTEIETRRLIEFLLDQLNGKNETLTERSSCEILRIGSSEKKKSIITFAVMKEIK